MKLDKGGVLWHKFLSPEEMMILGMILRMMLMLTVK